MINAHSAIFRAPVDDDAVISHSSLEQQRIEKLVAELFRLAFEEDNVYAEIRHGGRVADANGSLWNPQAHLAKEYASSVSTSTTHQSSLRLCVIRCQQTMDCLLGAACMRPARAHYSAGSESEVCPLRALTVAFSLSNGLRRSLVTFLNRCQHPSGGFGGGPTQRPHLATTYAAVNALCMPLRLGSSHSAYASWE